MEHKWLEDFVALARLRSFSRAAEARNVTQPAFSRRIRALEYWLGVTLLDRSSVPVVLTEAGGEFLPRARAMLADAEAARHDLRLLHDAGDWGIRVISMHTLALHVLPPVIERFLERHREASVSILPTVQEVEQYFEALVTGAADIVVTYEHSDLALEEAIKRQLTAIRVHDDALVPVAAPALAATLGPGWLDGAKASVPMLAYAEFSFSQRLLEPLMRRLAPKLRRVVASPLSENLWRFAEAGSGVAWLPRRLVADALASGKLEVLPGDGLAVPVNVTAWRRTVARGPLVEAFWELFVDQGGVAFEQAKATAAD